MTRPSKLHAVIEPSNEIAAVKRIGPQLTPLTLARAWALYPDNPQNAAAWLRAVHWLRERPGPSRWVLDKDSPRPSWSAATEHDNTFAENT